MDKTIVPLSHPHASGPDIETLSKAAQLPAQSIIAQVQLLQTMLDQLAASGTEADAALVLKELRYALPLLEQCAARSVARVQAMVELMEMHTPLLVHQRAPLKLCVLLQQFIDRRLPHVLTAWHADHVKVQLDLLAPEPVWIVGEAEALMHMLEQLVTNAASALVDHLPALTTCAAPYQTKPQPQIWLRLMHKEQWAILTVEDNGPGFPIYLLGDNLQVSGFVPHALRQSGLGLRSVLARVRRMGGKVTLKNNPPPQGASITIELPMLLAH